MRGKKMKTFLKCALCLVLAISLAGCGAISTIMTPDLEENRILRDLNIESYAASGVTQSAWGSNTGYQVDSTSITNRENTEYDNLKMQSVYIDTVISNKSFQVSSSWILGYELHDGEWIMVDSLETQRNIQPIGGIDDDKVLERVPTYFQTIDQDPVKDISGKTLKLQDLYKKNLTYELLSNEITGQSGTAKISISSLDGFAAYEGVITVSFAWDGSDWEISGASATRDSYDADYSSLIGTWVGTLENTSHGRNSSCYGGRGTPVVLTFKEVDSVAMTAIADIAFLAHAHAVATNSEESNAGDIVITLTDVLVPVKPGQKTTLQSVKDPAVCEISVTYGENGTLTAETRSREPMWFSWLIDTFSMEKTTTEQ